MTRFLAFLRGSMLQQWRQAAQIRLLAYRQAGHLFLGGGTPPVARGPVTHPCVSGAESGRCYNPALASVTLDEASRLTGVVYSPTTAPMKTGESKGEGGHGCETPEHR